MRILAISDLYPPDIRGGAEVVTSEAVDGLRERGHEVLVVTGGRGAALPHVRRCLQYHPSPRWQGGRAWLAPWRAVASYRRAFRNRANEAALRNLMAEVAPDVVYLGGVGGVSPCSILRALRGQPVPVVAHLHEYWLPNLLGGGGEFAGLRLPRLKRLLNGLDADRDLRFTSLIAISRTVRDRYQKAGFTPDAIEVCPNGLRLPHVERSREPRPVDGTLRLLFVGRLDPEKGAHLLLERLAAVAFEPGRPDIHCDLVGAPGPTAYMRQLHELLDGGALRGSVRLLGPMEREKTLGLYAQYDAVVVPSLWAEPFSLVVPEALAGGAAVIASRRVGAAEWFEDGRELLLFSPETPWDLDRALRRLRDEHGLATGLARAGSGKARQVFDPDAFLDRVERHLERAIGRPKCSLLVRHGEGVRRAVPAASRGEKRAA